MLEHEKDLKFRRHSNRRPGESEALRPGDPNGRHVILFKRKDQRENQRDDKADVFRSVAGLGDYENYVNMTKDYVTGGKKIKNNKVNSTGRNESDTYNPLAPTYTTIKDINRYEVPALIVTVNDEQLEKLRRHPDIRRIDKVREYKIEGQETPWGIERIDAHGAWSANSNRRGAGASVVVADTCVDSKHEDLTARFWQGISVVPDGTDFVWNKKFSDSMQHGTHVSGTVCADDNDVGVVGVAPRAWLAFCRIFDKKTVFASDEYAMASVEWAINIQAQHLTWSFGGIGEDNGQEWFIQAMEDLITSAHLDYSINITASAGNDGVHNMDGSHFLGRQHAPSGYTDCIEVSALTNGEIESVTQQDQGAKDHIAYFSNYGTKTELAAPGININSSFPDDKYGLNSGTSMASPHVAGSFILAWEAFRFDPCQDVYKYSTNKAVIIRRMMQLMTDRLGIWNGWTPGFGWGIVNPADTCKKLERPDGMSLASSGVA